MERRDPLGGGAVEIYLTHLSSEGDGDEEAKKADDDGDGDATTVVVTTKEKGVEATAN
jgi:hypothetical protein